MKSTEGTAPGGGYGGYCTWWRVLHLMEGTEGTAPCEEYGGYCTL